MSDGYKMFQEGYSKGFEDGVKSNISAQVCHVLDAMDMLIDGVNDEKYNELEKCYNKIIDKVIKQ